MNEALPLPPSAERYVLALQSINEAVYDYDATNGEIYYAPQLRTMLAVGSDELRTVEDWTRRIHPEDLEPYRRNWRALFTGEHERLVSEYRYCGSVGRRRWGIPKRVVTLEVLGR